MPPLEPWGRAKTKGFPGSLRSILPLSEDQNLPERQRPTVPGATTSAVAELRTQGFLST